MGGGRGSTLTHADVGCACRVFFGIVYRNRQVAIKVIKNRRQFHKQALLELEILNELNKRDADDQKNIGMGHFPIVS